MKAYVMDSNVLMDMLFVERDRHERASVLEELLSVRGARCWSPATALIECIAGAAQEVKRLGRSLTPPREIGNVLRFTLEWVTIDTGFTDEFVKPFGQLGTDLPRGGDLPFFFMALRKQVPLVSEDIALRGNTIRAGGQAFTIEECIRDLSA